jgi:hypothetical protein
MNDGVLEEEQNVAADVVDGEVAVQMYEENSTTSNT